MPYRVASEEVTYLRAKAEQFRKLGTDHRTPISWQLLELADQLEQRARELEERYPAPQ